MLYENIMGYFEQSPNTVLCKGHESLAESELIGLFRQCWDLYCKAICSYKVDCLPFHGMFSLYLWVSCWYFGLVSPKIWHFQSACSARVCSCMCVCLCSLHFVQFVPRLMPQVTWDRLQASCDLVQNKWCR